MLFQIICTFSRFMFLHHKFKTYS